MAFTPATRAGVLDHKMILQERTWGDHHVYAGAIESPRGGYTAAIIIQRRIGKTQQEVFRDDTLACAYRWKTAQEAIDYAINRAREVLNRQAAQQAADQASHQVVAHQPAHQATQLAARQGA